MFSDLREARLPDARGSNLLNKSDNIMKIQLKRERGGNNDYLISIFFSKIIMYSKEDIYEEMVIF